MPSKPNTVAYIDETPPYGKLKYISTTYRGLLVYTVGYVDYPIKKEDDKANKKILSLLRQGIIDLAKVTSNKLLRNEDIVVEGYPGGRVAAAP